jgi:hypothetical protein
MKLQHFYLIFCVIGFILPYSRFVPWVFEHGLNLQLLFRELFANRISAFFALDVIFSAIVLLWFRSKWRTVHADATPLVPDAGHSVRRCFAWSAAFSLFAAIQARSPSRLKLKQ